MEFINQVLGTPLGYIMKLCYEFVGDYGFSIILFTLITKIILFPVSMMVQKNSIKMIKIKPKLEALKHECGDDKDLLLDMESKLYKEEKYSPFAGTIPLLIQLPLVLGLIDVVYRPLKHILRLPTEVIQAFIAKTSELSGLAELGASPELMVMKYVTDPQYTNSFLSLQDSSLKGYQVNEFMMEMQSINMNFFGVDLAITPSVLSLNLLFLIPVFAGLSALIMCIIQNKINVLQIEQSKMAQWGMTLFMIVFSSYFAFLIPAGVGVYWIFGNLFSIPVMYLVNKIDNPSKYIDYQTLNRIKERAIQAREKKKKEAVISKKYYHELCKNGHLKKMNVMFYSEQSGFYKYFQNIIEAMLEKTEEPIYYISSDPNDAIFNHPNPQIKAYYLGETHLIPFMMKLECKVVVTTTPDLQKYHIKRSKVRKNIEYIYLDHACASLNMGYRPGALDYYDTILAVSQQQGIEVREMEKLRNAKKKRIVKCGYGLIDNMIQSYKALPKEENEKPIIMIAPSWQHDNLLDSCIDDMLSQLVCDEFKVIVRPHPQYIKRFPDQMENIMERYKNKIGENFIFETDFSSNSSVYTADLLITDWSAISFEFSFTTNKPTLFVNTDIKILNKDYDKIQIKPYDISGRNIIGKTIEKENVKSIRQFVEEILKNQETYHQRIEKEKNEYFYNLGDSGVVGADYIISKI